MHALKYNNIGTCATLWIIVFQKELLRWYL